MLTCFLWQFFSTHDTLPEFQKPLKQSYIHGACEEPLIARTVGSLLDEAAACHADHKPFKCLTFEQEATFLEISNRVSIDYKLISTCTWNSI